MCYTLIHIHVCYVYTTIHTVHAHAQAIDPTAEEGEESQEDEEDEEMEHGRGGSESEDGSDGGQPRGLSKRAAAAAKRAQRDGDLLQVRGSAWLGVAIHIHIRLTYTLLCVHAATVG